jgi:HAD superfamily hydrolase (TIGR01509 family)
VNGRRRGVLFDVDGTLVDTTYLHTVAWWQAFAEYGHTVSMARIHRAVGMGADHIVDELLGTDRDRGDDDAMAHAHAALTAVHWPTMRATRGAAELVRGCATRGLVVVLASSASGRELAALRAAIGADDVIDSATGAEDGASKPSPDIVAAALSQANLDADAVVYIGDSVWDVYATGKLGIACIGLTCGGTSAAELTAAGAVTTYPDPAALLCDIDQAIMARLP